MKALSGRPRALLLVGLLVGAMLGAACGAGAVYYSMQSTTSAAPVAVLAPTAQAQPTTVPTVMPVSAQATADGYCLAYLHDMSGKALVEDGWDVVVGDRVNKAWLVKNCGTKTIPADFFFRPIEGPPGGIIPTFEVGRPINPGESAIVGLNMTIPAGFSSLTIKWQLDRGDGYRFGDWLGYQTGSILLTAPPSTP